jgi:hypothetical protein
MSSQPSNIIPFEIPPHHQSISLPQARLDLPPELFRSRLRRHLLEHPGLTLAQVAAQLNVSRQRVSLMVGRLNRPNCATGKRPAPKLAQAKKKVSALIKRVQAGETATQAAAALNLSLPQVYRLGFRTHLVRPPHGRGRQDCNCWRCRRSSGVVVPRGTKMGPMQRAQAEDWLAWTDPDTNEPLTQAAIGKLTGMRQSAVSRIAKQMAEAE